MKFIYTRKYALIDPFINWLPIYFFKIFNCNTFSIAYTSFRKMHLFWAALAAKSMFFKFLLRLGYQAGITCMVMKKGCTIALHNNLCKWVCKNMFCQYREILSRIYFTYLLINMSSHRFSGERISLKYWSCLSFFVSFSFILKLFFLLKIIILCSWEHFKSLPCPGNSFNWVAVGKQGRWKLILMTPNLFWKTFYFNFDQRGGITGYEWETWKKHLCHTCRYPEPFLSSYRFKT